jgi:polyketide cyclase/dehydrase/lipid transport protein
MYQIKAETIIEGDPSAVWEVVADVDGWPSWDPHEEEAHLDGPFATGTTGWSKPRHGPGTGWTITAVVEGRRWASECALPGGKLTGENLFEPLDGGQIRCVKTVNVTGPLVPLFWLHFGRGIRKDMYATFAALEREAARRHERAAS